mgnify:CR=1 FL=1
MNNIIIGQYVPGNSFLYKMDPRSKLIALFVFMISVFIMKNLLHLAIMLVIVILILRIGGIQIGRIFKGLKPIMFLLTFTFIFQLLFVKGEETDLLVNSDVIVDSINIFIFVGMFILWRLLRKVIKYRFLLFVSFFVGSFLLFINFTPGNPLFDNPYQLEIYQQGLEGALFIMTRLIVIVTMSTILTLTTKPTDLNLGLEKVLKPLKIIGVNTEIMAMIIAIALRYIPTLLDEANKIMLAQASRGVDFSEGKFKDKVMQIISLLVPMFIISFKRSDELADAMEARNFVPGKRRTRIHLLKWSNVDTILITVSLLTLTGVIVTRILGW